MSNDTNDNLLAVRGLKTYFPFRKGLFGKKRFVRAVDGVDLTVRRKRTVALVGESGSGKTTVGRTILRLLPAHEGTVEFDGRDVLSMDNRQLKQLRRRLTVIFQDPVGSLNPRMTVGDIVSEPLATHGMGNRRERVETLLEQVGLSPRYINRYPHEFSGGQRQRIGIARALASEPEFIICDEPVSALDVSIQAQILNLLKDLQQQLNLSYLFIAHNLAVVEHFADEVAVMYLGRIVEHASRDALYDRPLHPYTESLLLAAPRTNPDRELDRPRLAGEMPSPVSPPPGCPFHPRCPLTRELAKSAPSGKTVTITSEGEPVRILQPCATQRPTLQPSQDDPQHLHACVVRQQGLDQ